MTEELFLKGIQEVTTDCLSGGVVRTRTTGELQDVHVRLILFVLCGVGAVMVMLYTVCDGTVRDLRVFYGLFDRPFHLTELITEEQVRHAEGTDVDIREIPLISSVCVVEGLPSGLPPLLPPIPSCTVMVR